MYFSSEMNTSDSAFDRKGWRDKIQKINRSIIELSNEIKSTTKRAVCREKANE